MRSECLAQFISIGSLLVHFYKAEKRIDHAIFFIMGFGPAYFEKYLNTMKWALPVSL